VAVLARRGVPARAVIVDDAPHGKAIFRASVRAAVTELLATAR
jgi:hypothetical protein